MSSEIIPQLIETIITIDDLKLLRQEVSQLKKSVYQNGKNALDKVLSDQVRISTAKILETSLTTQPDSLLTEIETQLANLPILRLRLAFSPTRTTLEKIATWLRKNSTPHWVLEIQIDPEILAGTIIEVNGFYRDFSYRDKISQSIQQATKKILESEL